MLRPPTDLELEQLLEHANAMYDPVKAHEYYERTKNLKGRRRARPQDNGNQWKQIKKEIGPETGKRGEALRGKTKAQIHQGAKARQKKELAQQIQNLEAKLKKLDDLIREKVREAAKEDRKSKAKKERAAKEKDKPKTAAEKAEAARESKKYRDKHKQELKNKAKDGKSGGGDDKKQKSAKDMSVRDLKTLATKVRGQISVAKTKLAAL